MAEFNQNQDDLITLERMLQEQIDFLNTITRPEFGAIKSRLLKNTLQDQRWLSMLTGNVTNINASASVAGSNDANPLVKKPGDKYIMGKLVYSEHTPVSKADVQPTKDDAKQFKAKVQDLYNGWLGLKDSDLMNVLSRPGGENLIRGVAKMAGVRDWNSRESSDIDVMFFAQVASAITLKAKGDKLNADIDERLDESAEDEADPLDEIEEDEAPAQKKAVKKSAPAKKAVAPKKSAAKKSVLDDDDDL